ncbi:DUF1643 domain-containing protein [Burkholderia ubonensis]|uniref:DUF1643 domain-containing protein n=1 Tax=Burkholderia ubonensis TaxID=101571 RepID=UPI000AA4334D|nr:DUF1643 domain-containing protein [Burkholderia ubonensis]
MNIPHWVEENAHFSGPSHRVWLRRRISMFGSPVGMILHNPSVAGADRDDPTARRGISFAAAMGASDLIFVNVATGIATDADDLAAMDDPIGPMADEALLVAAKFCLSQGGAVDRGVGRAKRQGRDAPIDGGALQSGAATAAPFTCVAAYASRIP